MKPPPPLRVGRIPYANLYPVFRALEDRLDPGAVRYVEGDPARLNRLLRAGRLDLSPSSSIEYGKHPARYLLCPGISVASRGRVMSVLLLSRMPLRNLPDDPVTVTGSSDTSVVLLDILFRESLGRRIPLLRTTLPPRLALARHPAHLAIGDEAIRAQLSGAAPHVTDLGAWWRRETGTPFVFALWIAHRNAAEGKGGPLRSFARTLLRAKRDAKRAVLRAPSPPGPAWIPREFLRAYWRNLSYDLGRETEGLTLFFRMAARIGAIPEAPRLRFLEVPGISPVVE